MMQECECGGAIYNGTCIHCGLEVDHDGMYDSIGTTEVEVLDIQQLIEDEEAELEEEAALGVNPRLEQIGFDQIESRLEESALDQETERGGLWDGPDEWPDEEADECDLEDEVDEDLWST